MTKLTLNRRQALALIGAAGTATACGRPAATDTPAAPAAVGEVFVHGVASGDPTATSLVLWTRVESDANVEPVSWEIARDAAFTDIVARGEAEARASADHTVKAFPDGLAPGAIYHFRFTARGQTSPVGRTQTLPTGTLDRLGIALVSCSNYTFGYFNAYDAIAKDDAIDFVLHTGDYIYEYGGPLGWGETTGATIGRPHDPPHEIVTLADYRRRHAQYKRDAGSRAMLAAKPLLACWDDHESANNPWKDGAQNHQPATEGDWSVRREAATQAYYEWMPIREPQAGQSRLDFWRSYVFGDLATLVTLETRHTARGRQVEYGEHASTITTQAERDVFMRDVIGDPSRRMIAPAMQADMVAAFAASVALGQPWRLVGNASPIARMLVPDVLAHGLNPARAPLPEQPGVGTNLLWKAKWNLPFYTDTWDGYPAAREEFYTACRDAGASDLVVLTGDSHSFWANELFDGEGRRMGVELGTAGVTSPGDFVETGWPAEEAAQLDRIFETALDEVRWTDNFHQGYVRVVLGREAADIAYVAMDNILTTQYRPFVLREERVVHEGDSLRYA